MDTTTRNIVTSLVNSYFFRDLNKINCENLCVIIEDEYYDKIDKAMSFEAKEYCQLVCGETSKNVEKAMKLVTDIQEQEPLGVIPVTRAQFVGEFLDNCLKEAGRSYGFDEAGIQKQLKSMGL